MLDQIVFTGHLPYIEDDDPVQPLQLRLSLIARGKTAMIDCIVASLAAIEQANRTYDPEARRIAIIEYNDNHKRARRNKISMTDINNKCGQAHYLVLAANLMGVALATVTGDYYNQIETLLEWYEDDRHRMIEAGFYEDVIDSRMVKIKLKLVKK